MFSSFSSSIDVALRRLASSDALPPHASPSFTAFFIPGTSFHFEAGFFFLFEILVHTRFARTTTKGKATGCIPVTVGNSK